MVSRSNKICIIGSGLTAKLSAIITSRYGASVTLYRDSSRVGQSQRLYALNYFSQCFLSHSKVEVDYAEQFSSIETWVDGSDLSITFLSTTLGVPQLGGLVSHGVLDMALDVAISKSNIQIIDIEQKQDSVELLNSCMKEYSMVLVANAKSCPLFSYYQIPYHQKITTAQVSLLKHKQQRLYQSFDSNQSVGLLPFSENQASLIYSSNKDSSQDLLASCEKLFNKRISLQSVTQVETIPEVTFRIAKKTVHDNVIVLGDSCDTIHPLAGQGLNQAISSIFYLDYVVAKSNNTLDLATFQNYQYLFFARVRPRSLAVHGFAKILGLPTSALKSLFVLGEKMPLLEQNSLTNALGMREVKLLKSFERVK
ncbi:MAG: FAD-dependent monooxygenase [Methylacidiphilales bacterium]|nr:FAD-dependent monooxygenase [Candidatus Methylacidiphilales bacterium]